jgi:carboxylesterase
MEWNEPLFEAGAGHGQAGVLVLHGFGGSPRSLQELAERLVGAGYAVALPLLAGHGCTPEEMERSRRTDWLADAEGAFAWLAEQADQIFVVGLSMGGTLALGVVERHPEVSGLVLINSLVRHPHELAMRLLGRLGMPRWVPAVANDINCPGVDERAYGRLPSRATRQLALLSREVRRDLPKVTCPVLLFSSTVDHVVPPANQREIYASIGSADKALISLGNSYHVATMDYDKDEVFRGTLRFIAEHMRVSSPSAVEKPGIEGS